ncbi:ABC transporter ATP-binding protein [Microtetraspora sp. NBRC 16547]|uniref:ABC transporter ATP-binding protein n=1 Tax=Microtetraspora sp. NBRC 16547 TaxID=3030993 RepID=UPI0024A56B65|nr:ABC transporter ATP-binding protein [Microtetraspora sp. NBRC 16547]GLX02399.1 ABC transporter ATP-binding protein [Microtetraspora sp. NBRC 16547]
MSANVLELDDVRLALPSRHGDRTLLRGVSLSLAPGEALGLVGESGSGKSMTLRTVLRTEPPGARVTGRVLLDGEDVRLLGAAALRRVRAERLTMISQNPRAALNPVLRISRYLVEGLCDARGESRDEATRRARDLLARVGIADVDRCMDAYPHQLSGGMLQRVVIAAAMASSPRLLLADEPTTALDVTTQSEVMAILDEQRREHGMAMLFVTHDLELASAVCDRIAVLYAGEIVEIGTPAQLHSAPRHPYTRLLLDSRPSLTAKTAALPVIPGRPIAAYEVEGGCAFSGRCPWVAPRCSEGEVALVHDAGRATRCLRADELTAELAGPAVSEPAGEPVQAGETEETA